MTQKGREVRAMCKWQGQGYKRNCGESCPAKQLKCIMLSWEERERKPPGSCPAYYECWAQMVICTVHHDTLV